MSEHFATHSINYATAARLVELALRCGATMGVKPIVTVVDPSLALVAFGRADGATPHSVETSRRKAQTAASTRRPSSALSPELAVALEHGSGGILTSIHGGVPIQFGGVHIGGLGIAGGTPAQDAEIAIAVIAEIGADAGNPA